jgi:hypothetical protein
MKTFLQKVLIIWLSAFTFFLVAPSLFHNGDNVYNSTVLESKNYNGYFPLKEENKLKNLPDITYQNALNGLNYYSFYTYTEHIGLQYYVLLHGNYYIFAQDDNDFINEGFPLYIDFGATTARIHYSDINSYFCNYSNGCNIIIYGISNYESEE